MEEAEEAIMSNVKQKKVRPRTADGAIRLRFREDETLFFY